MPKVRDANGRYIPAYGLTKQQAEAIMLIVYDGAKGRAVYEKVGVPSSTYYDWYKQDLFKEELEKEQKAMRRQLKHKAWKRLDEVIENASYRDVVPAIKMVLSDKEDNFYLNDKSELTINTKDIVVRLADTEE